MEEETRKVVGGKRIVATTNLRAALHLIPQDAIMFCILSVISHTNLPMCLAQLS